jgi:hypothetical protein
LPVKGQNLETRFHRNHALKRRSSATSPTSGALILLAHVPAVLAVEQGAGDADQSMHSLFDEVLT